MTSNTVLTPQRCTMNRNDFLRGAPAFCLQERSGKNRRRLVSVGCGQASVGLLSSLCQQSHKDRWTQLILENYSLSAWKFRCIGWGKAKSSGPGGWKFKAESSKQTGSPSAKPSIPTFQYSIFPRHLFAAYPIISALALRAGGSTSRRPREPGFQC